MSTLRDRLADLAGTVGPTAGTPAPELWRRGRRRARLRRTAAVAGVLATAVLAAGVSGLLVRSVDHVEPAATTGRTVLPDRFYEPSGWLPVADGPTGPLVAVVPAEHRTWTGSEPGLVRVSATTQDYAFLDLPDLVQDGSGNELALSPDGRYLAYWYGTRAVRHTTVAADGVAVLDTTTGRTERHALASDLGLQLTPLLWGGDRLWFTQLDYTDIQESNASAERVASWAWDLGRGEPREVDDPDSLLVSGVGPAGDGFLARDGRRFYEVSDDADLTAPAVAELAADRQVPSGAVSPDRTRLALTVEARNSNRTHLELVQVDTGSSQRLDADLGDYAQVVGWLDDQRVAVQLVTGGWRALVAVDSSTGDTEVLSRLDRSSTGEQWATGLLDAPVVAADAPPRPLDPRLVVAGSALLVLLAGVVVALWRRRARR